MRLARVRHPPRRWVAVRAPDRGPERLRTVLDGRRPDAPALLARLGDYVPEDGRLRVSGGLPDEALRPLDFAPEPGRPARTLLDEATVARDLQRLADEQEQDGGWSVDFRSYSPAAALEWRGYTTVQALSILRDNATS